MLTQEIAEEIVKETMRRLNRNINIMDPTGTIIASGDSTRISYFHEGGFHVIKSGKPLVITKHNKDQWRGSKIGINLPIEFQNKIIGVIGITGEQNEVEEFGELVKMTTEMMIKQSYLATQSEWQARSKEETFVELVKEKPNYDFIDQRLELLQINLIPPFHMFLIEIKLIKIQSQSLIRKLEEIFNKKCTLIGFLEVGRMFILSSGISSKQAIDKINIIQDMLTKLQIQCKIGYGTPVYTREMLKVSFNESEIALSIGKVRELSFNSYSNMEAEALIIQIDEDLKKRFLERIFPTIDAKVIETLQAFFQCNFNITETASKLFIHRNTLIYRLKKIKEETGYDPQVFKDSVPLQLAIWMYVNKLSTTN
ncbi:CdaR family transcriptional regulator [Metabacillus sediminilitoris]|uniref:Carbohydrate diacid regulator n=1 Tax=Metabacillus sediminilitoris TaxID=2567941 RepID=A0A4S4BXT9_9BACI|nr:sugar diacid recognition domain-containing protein [Metabacillus sediminilitoris]QGQ46290.1 hypothetical protein GMB29_14320 [Metabacillus sediminilitoris]THF79341.1 hypothetical protein E6W99_13420 [Metabacillus sediminilitoris]